MHLLKNLLKIKCFLVNLLREIYQLCLTWLYNTHNVNIFKIIWMKVSCHFYNILRLPDILPNFPFTTSETVHDYYL